MNEQHDNQLYLKSVYPSIQRERAEIMGSEVFVVVMLISSESRLTSFILEARKKT